MASLKQFPLMVFTLYVIIESTSSDKNYENEIYGKDAIKYHKKHICPKQCGCLNNEAYCDGHMLHRVPHGFSPMLKTINMRSNFIRRVKYRHFKYLYNVKHLLMRDNKIFYIETGAFRDMMNLISLSLTNNRLRHLSPGTFEGLSRLQLLSMRENMISNIELLFTNLKSLQLLNLGGNRIRFLTNSTFKGNPNIRVLDMHNNSISSIHKDTFKMLPLLKFLVLRDNPLKRVEMDFKLNFHLELLDFTNCKLKEMVRGMPHSISDLRLSENHIRYIDKDAFKTTKKIRLLVLNKNKIRRIHEDAFSDLWQLYSLYMGANGLEEFPQNLTPTIRGLYMNHNKIKFIPPESCANLTKLEYFYIKNNSLINISDTSMTGLKSLKILDLSYNKIPELRAHIFSDMKVLENLDISHNPLEKMEHGCFSGLEHMHILEMASVGKKDPSIPAYVQTGSYPPSVFESMKGLMYLDLSNSSDVARHLAENPHVLNYLITVHDLNLMNNDLYGLPPDFPKHFPYLKDIKLTGNPWHCDESILWLAKWMHNRFINFFHRDEMKCASPPEMKGKLIHKLSEAELPRIYTQAPQTPKSGIIDIEIVHEDGVQVSSGEGPQVGGPRILSTVKPPWYWKNVTLRTPPTFATQNPKDAKPEGADEYQADFVYPKMYYKLNKKQKIKFRRQWAKRMKAEKLRTTLTTDSPKSTLTTPASTTTQTSTMPTTPTTIPTTTTTIPTTTTTIPTTTTTIPTTTTTIPTTPTTIPTTTTTIPTTTTTIPTTTTTIPSTTTTIPSTTTTIPTTTTTIPTTTTTIPTTTTTIPTTTTTIPTTTPTIPTTTPSTTITTTTIPSTTTKIYTTTTTPEPTSTAQEIIPHVRIWPVPNRPGTKYHIMTDENGKVVIRLGLTREDYEREQELRKRQEQERNKIRGDQMSSPKVAKSTVADLTTNHPIPTETYQQYLLRQAKLKIDRLMNIAGSRDDGVKEEAEEVDEVKEKQTLRNEPVSTALGEEEKEGQKIRHASARNAQFTNKKAKAKSRRQKQNKQKKTKSETAYSNSETAYPNSGFKLVTIIPQLEDIPVYDDSSGFSGERDGNT